MKLPFFHKKQEKKDFFLALLFKQEKIGAILFEEKDSKLIILDTKEENIKKEIQEVEEEDIIDVSDKVITSIEENLPPQESVHKTIFAVPHEWIEQGKIKNNYLAKLKKLCEELELTPIGFIVPIEAVIHFLQKKEGAPISSIFIEITKHIATIYITRSSNIIEVKQGVVKENIIQTVEGLLKEVEKFEVLPAKIVLLDYEGAQNTQQKFLSHSWTKDLPFLHLPQVVILEKGSENEAIVSGVASQMGFEVFQELKSNKSQEEKKEEKYIPIKNLVKKEELGFFKEKDVAKNQEFVKEKIEEVDEQEEIIKEEEKEAKGLEEDIEKEDTNKKEESNFKKENIKMKNITQVLSPLKGLHFPKLHFKIPFKSNLIIFAFIGIFLVIAVVFAYYNFLLKTEIVLFADNKNLNQETDVTFSTTEPTSVSSSKKYINIIGDSEEIEGNKEKETVGKKETGEKAKGEIIVYNKTDKSKTLIKGTVLGTQNGLKFELTSDVSIASTSVFSITPSNAKIKIEAVKFGSEYNLPSSTNFIFDDYPTSSFIAKNESALTGGTKKTIQVVSQKDLDELSSSLSSELEEKLISSGGSKKDSNTIILPKVLDFEFTEKNYDKKKDEEADSLTLSAKIKFNIAYYKKSELYEFIQELAKESIPENYSLVEESSKIEINNFKINKDGSIDANLIINAIYAPNIDSKNIKSNIMGKSKSAVENYLQKIPGISEFNIIHKNKLPLLPDILPPNSNNLIITIKRNV